MNLFADGIIQNITVAVVLGKVEEGDGSRICVLGQGLGLVIAVARNIAAAGQSEINLVVSGFSAVPFVRLVFVELPCPSPR